MKHTIEVDLKWYHFSQNNSGGYFVEDDNQGENVLIQARNAEEAWEIGCRFFDFSYCECCGERWSEPWYDDGTDEPEIYGIHIDKAKGEVFSNYAILHHYNGVVEKVKFK